MSLNASIALYQSILEQGGMSPEEIAALVKKHTGTLQERIAKREANVVSIYREVGQEMARLVEALDDDDLDKRASFDMVIVRSMALMAEAEDNLEELVQDAWREGSEESIKRAKKVFKDMPVVGGLQFGDELGGGATTFVNRIVRHLADPVYSQGLTLSNRVWNSTKDIGPQVIKQFQIGVSMGEGAAEIGKRIRAYLVDPNGTARQIGVVKALRTRARKARKAGDKEKARELFIAAELKSQGLPKVGRGVYRSATKNAQRLVRGEMIRAADQTDYEYAKSRSWIVGIGWQLSAAHPESDICDGYVGVYPKDNVPARPHAQCKCIKYPVPTERLTGEPVTFRGLPENSIALR